jgi:hypothetical protein
MYIYTVASCFRKRKDHEHRLLRRIRTSIYAMIVLRAQLGEYRNPDTSNFLLFNSRLTPQISHYSHGSNTIKYLRQK